MTSAAPHSLVGKVAIVTGGSRGLGREIAAAYAANGADVVVASRKLVNCEAAAAAIREETGATVVGVECHVGRWNDCDALFDRALSQFGVIDILVNNAGMSPLYDSLSSVGEDLFDKVIAVNLRGSFRLSALAAEHMKANRGGTIINVSSISSIQPGAGEIPYACAKAGVNALTVAMAHAFGPTVRVNGIMPGPFMTDISKAWDLEAFEQMARDSIPLQRGGRADEVVGAALYLASDASSYTTGAMIKIDGGATWSTN